MSTGSQGFGSNNQDCELNLAPIIDCFTVLITYLLISASFITVGMLDVNVASSGPGDETAQPPPVSVAVQMNEDRTLNFVLSGKENRTIPIPLRDGGWDWELVNENLNGLKERYPTLNTVMLQAQRNIEYRDLVRGIERVRKVIPGVFLGQTQVQ